ncbi:DNA-invertase hin (plasmid) [Roseobacter fucihabitans]|uniref:DNA-invertase hin n=1 Tax=Roseobacter fucihabitans TaxID=1537242 RepID=A0ABZ2C024_9RHOB|nr:recombinase family protein [Roseobacter litoralis]MBC6967254.1 DNA-invertase hin [Roseobacter litoralis]
MLIGHARVSTTGQNLESQIEHLQAEGCDKIFQEKLTGFNRRRPQLEKMLGILQPGDTLIVTSLDRLARSTHDVFVITQKVETIKAAFRSLREPWADTTSSMGKFLLTVFAGLSELERNLINERTDEGRTSAKRRGVKFGRKFKLTTHQQDQVRTMLHEGQSIRAIARHFNVGVATIDRIKRSTQLS